LIFYQSAKTEIQQILCLDPSDVKELTQRAQ